MSEIFTYSSSMLVKTFTRFGSDLSIERLVISSIDIFILKFPRGLALSEKSVLNKQNQFGSPIIVKC